MYLSDNDPKSEKYIQLLDMERLDNRILYELKFSDNLRKYFTTNQLEVEYDVPIKNADESILSIPALSCLITIAWPTGADIYLEKIDETYFESLKKLSSIYKKWYPEFPFTTTVFPTVRVQNTFNNEGHGLLFTGGVDSLSTYIMHKKDRPILITVHGVHHPLPEYENLKKLENWLEKFAKMEGLEVHFIKTNFSDILKRNLLDSEYGKKWGIRSNHSITILGLCTPLTTIAKIGVILISSSYPEDFTDFSRGGCDPLIDENVRWDSIKIIHEGYELSRHEKIKYLLKNNPQYNQYLRVCLNSRYDKYNCGNCEKCLRTITSLMLEDIDPKECNFDIKKNITEKIVHFLAKSYRITNSACLSYWKDMQKHIPEHINENKIYDSKKFFKSFKKTKLPDSKYEESDQKKNSLHRFVRKYYFIIKYFGVSYSLKIILKRILMVIKRLMRSRFKICSKCGTANAIETAKWCSYCNNEMQLDNRII